MMRMLAFIGLVVFGCADKQLPRCKEVCDREAECREERGDEQSPFDRRECTADCTNLSRDREGKQLVESHLDCAERATSCDALLACP